MNKQEPIDFKSMFQTELDGPQKIKNIAGCYGKQEPLDISNPNDVRDLYYLFGKDRKVQSKDPFFHNANSIIKKKTTGKK